jgi:phage recombination protein Bet
MQMSKGDTLFGFTPEEVKLIRQTVGKDAVSEAEFQRFLYRANKLGLNPLDGTIHLQSGNRKNQEGNWEKTNTIIVGIDGFRAVGDGTGKLNGIKRGVTRNEKGQLIEGWAEVYRKDWDFPARETVPYREYVQLKDGQPTRMWASKPETMLKKCAEAAAHRMAWAGVLSGVYIPEEMPDENIKPEIINGDTRTPPQGGAPKADTDQPTNGDSSKNSPEPPGENGGQMANNNTPSSTEPSKSRNQKNKGDKKQETAPGESGSTEPPKNNVGQSTGENPSGQKPTENPAPAEPAKGNGQAGNSTQKPANNTGSVRPEPFDGELIIMGSPEAMKIAPWMESIAFVMLSDETVKLLSNDGKLDGISQGDQVHVQGARANNQIKINNLTVIQKAVTDPGQQPEQNTALEQNPPENANEPTGTPVDEPASPKNAPDKPASEEAAIYKIVIKSAPVDGKKSGEDILWARAEMDGRSLLVVAQGNYKETFRAFTVDSTVMIKGALTQEGAKKFVLYYKGISEAKAA